MELVRDMKQLTTEEARAFFDRRAWKTWTHEQIAHFQIVQDKLCVPFGIFQEAVEKTLGRPVYTHEFGLNRDGLMRELEGAQGAPTLDEILALLAALGEL